MDRSITLRWENLNLSVKTNDFSFRKCRFEPKEINILNNVSGCLKSGQLVAIMGESGAGKTSLLASVSQRMRGKIDGHIYINGHIIDKNNMIKYSSFVSQFDITIDVLTVMEHMYFMTELKVGQGLSASEKHHRIEDILRRLNLTDYVNVRIEHLSGGTKKKLSLASEMITEPPIIFCDEPTTGLDSFNAKIVISALRDLTDDSHGNGMENGFNGSIESFAIDYGDEKHCLLPISRQYRKAVMVSIHQPTSQIYKLFTHLILMHQGRIVYAGSVEETKEFFNNLGLVCPLSYNPADYYVKQVTKDPDNPGDDAAKEGQIEKILDEFSSTQLVTHEEPLDTDFGSLNYKKLNWFVQVGLLIKRSMLRDSRMIKDIAIQLCVYIASALAIGFVYSVFNDPTMTEVQGIFFVSTCEVIFTTSYHIILQLPDGLPFIRRENGEKTYSLSAYYVANMILIRIPFSVMYAFLFSGLMCLFTGFLRSFKVYFYMSFVLTITGIGANAYGCLTSTLFETVRLTTEIAAPIDLFLLLMGGQYKNAQSLGFLKYLSLFFYSNEMLVTFFAQTHPEIPKCTAYEEDYCPENSSFDRTIPYFQILYTDILYIIGISIVMHLISYFRLRQYVNRTGFY